MGMWMLTPSERRRALPVRLLLPGRNERQYAAGGTLVLWGLALAGLNTFNGVGFTASNLFICLLAGYAPASLAASRPGPLHNPPPRHG